jgi:beta-glucuronidase
MAVEMGSRRTADVWVLPRSAENPGHPECFVTARHDAERQVACDLDPYENGYYDYRRQPFDATTPARGGYFLDHKPADRSELVEYDFDTSPTLTVPGDWNSQEDRLFYYEGTVWYRRKFDYTPASDKRVFVHFGAANYQADVYLNGRKLGHIGGFTPFEFEITGV